MAGLKRLLIILVSVVLAVPATLLAFPQDAQATTVTDFAMSSDLRVHGDYILVGNGVLTCTGTDCTNLQSGGTLANDDNTMVYTGAKSGWLNSSSATLTVPAGAWTTP